MLTIGCHLSISRGYAAMGRTALQIGANTFAFFTRNPRGGTAKVPDPDDVAELRRIAREHAFGPLVAHAPYTYNLCSAKERAREFALEGMCEDLERLELLPGTFYNFHPGAHVGQGMERGIERIAEALGHIIVARNWKYRHLEVDIISLKDGGLHFVEVKSRTAPASAAPETNVGGAKQRRLTSAALAFLNSGLRKTLPPDLEVFFDIVTLLFDGPDFELKYYPQAFIPTYA